MNASDLTAGFNRGVRIAGTGSAVPDRVLSNHDLAKMMDTSDEWITQRTGIKRRRICDPKTENGFTMARSALLRAVDDSGIDPTTVAVEAEWVVPVALVDGTLVGSSHVPTEAVWHAAAAATWVLEASSER